MTGRLRVNSNTRMRGLSAIRSASVNSAHEKVRELFGELFERELA